MKFFYIFILSLLPFSANGSEVLMHRLDSVIALRRHYMDIKENRIKKLTHEFHVASPAKKLQLSSKLYKEYYTYQFDSAMYYVRQNEALARRLGNAKAERMAQINFAYLLTVGGFYSQAEKMLNAVKVDTTDTEEAFYYYVTGYWIYNYWGDYCRDKLFFPEFRRRAIKWLSKALPYYPDKTSAGYQFYLAELAFFKDKDIKTSTRHYLNVVKMAPVNTRFYACAAYGLARNYKMQGRMQDYEDWLIRSAISDQVNPLKENLALQELAMYLFKKDENNAEKSTHYIYCSMEDAQFYHNRLRMLEISQRLPAIVSVYQQQINDKRRSVTYLSMSLGLIVVVLLFSIWFIKKQSGRLHRRGMEIDRQNKELETLNARLRKTDETRGKYMRLFMDLCATYIGKMNDYRKLVMRKVKAHQTEDLLRSATSTKLTDQEAAQFYTQFDRAFLELYPTFVSDFNALLRPDCRLELSRNGSLTTEMRIYALVRLGVGESVEIATLLFYSPQTIYNYRTAMRKRAINPDTFEEDVKALK